MSPQTLGPGLLDQDRGVFQANHDPTHRPTPTVSGGGNWRLDGCRLEGTPSLDRTPKV